MWNHFFQNQVLEFYTACRISTPLLGSFVLNRFITMVTNTYGCWFNKSVIFDFYINFSVHKSNKETHKIRCLLSIICSTCYVVYFINKNNHKYQFSSLKTTQKYTYTTFLIEFELIRFICKSFSKRFISVDGLYYLYSLKKYYYIILKPQNT